MSESTDDYFFLLDNTTGNLYLPESMRDEYDVMQDGADHCSLEDWYAITYPKDIPTLMESVRMLQTGEKDFHDINEPVTLIKMDIEGAEQSALKGCLRHIEEDQPKLALSVYHNFEDIWKLAKMVDETTPGYRFYLRYHGGNLWPSEISLLALPPKE